MAEEKTKTVKLQSKIRLSKKQFSGQKSVPWLTLSGVWLEKNGFNIGDVLRVTSRERLLIIEVAEKNINQ
jgi:toxic protein SymE